MLQFLFIVCSEFVSLSFNTSCIISLFASVTDHVRYNDNYDCHLCLRGVCSPFVIKT